MANQIINVVTTIFIVTAIGIALRPKAPTANVITAIGNSIAKMQTASFGPS